MKVFNDDRERMTVQPNWEKFGLKGKVKSIRTKIYDAHFLEGRVIKGFRENDDFFGFNEKGNLIKNRDEKDEETQIYQYDENDRLVRCDYQNDDNEIYSFEIYQYDNNGNRVKYEYVLSDNSVEESCVAEYDENNLLIKHTDEDGRGKIFEYNEKQQVIKSREIGKWSDKMFNQHRYDDLGRLVEVQDCTDTTSEYEGIYVYKSTFYIYDENRNLAKERNLYYENDEYRYPIFYKHNEHGDEIEKVKFISEKPWITHSEYKYDEIGNWTKKIVYENNRESVNRIIFREIEYYE